MRWTPLSPDLYRATANGAAWLLEHTPDRPKPWLLVGNNVSQEIGTPSVAAAQRQAEFWLEASRLVPAPRR